MPGEMGGHQFAFSQEQEDLHTYQQDVRLSQGRELRWAVV